MRSILIEISSLYFGGGGEPPDQAGYNFSGDWGDLVCKLSTPSSSLSSRKGNIKGGTSLARLTKKRQGSQIPQKKIPVSWTEMIHFIQQGEKQKPCNYSVAS